MAGPFPGMDPYLEARDLWSDVHTMLVPRLRVQIASRLPPGYLVRTGERVVIWPEEGGEEALMLPDAVITDTATDRPPGTAAEPVEGCVLVRARIPEEHSEHFVRIFHRDREQAVGTIELLSYSNKLAGDDRSRYLSIRARTFLSSCHLVEIDLLRSGNRMPMDDPLPPSHYLVLVSPFPMRPTCRAYPFGVRESVPEVEVPLLGTDRFRLDVGRALAEVYDECRYSLLVDYAAEPRPRFRGSDGAWVAERAASANAASS
mgnify:CR=1 FL=1